MQDTKKLYTCFVFEPDFVMATNQPLLDEYFCHADLPEGAVQRERVELADPIAAAERQRVEEQERCEYEEQQRAKADAENAAERRARIEAYQNAKKGIIHHVQTHQVSQKIMPGGGAGQLVLQLRWDWPPTHPELPITCDVAVFFQDPFVNPPIKLHDQNGQHCDVEFRTATPLDHVHVTFKSDAGEWSFPEMQVDLVRVGEVIEAMEKPKAASSASNPSPVELPTCTEPRRVDASPLGLECEGDSEVAVVSSQFGSAPSSPPLQGLLGADDNAEAEKAESSEYEDDDCGLEEGADISAVLNDPNFQSVYNALESMQIPVNAARKNIGSNNGQVIRSLVLGVTHHRSQGIVAAKATRTRPNLSKTLVNFFLTFAKKALPSDFYITSITVNKNVESANHVDPSNLGPSYIVGLGDYTGGRLWVHTEGALDCHNKWVCFDGNIPHRTLPFAGTRYTLIFYTQQSYSRLGGTDRAFLEDVGFTFPPVHQDKGPYGLKSLRLQCAEEAFGWWEAASLQDQESWATKYQELKPNHTKLREPHDGIMANEPNQQTHAMDVDSDGDGNGDGPDAVLPGGDEADPCRDDSPRLPA